MVMRWGRMSPTRCCCRFRSCGWRWWFGGRRVVMWPVVWRCRGVWWWRWTGGRRRGMRVWVGCAGREAGRRGWGVVGWDGQDWSVSEEVTADWFAPLPLGQRLVPAQWAGLRDKAFVQTVVSESVDIQPGGAGGVLTPVAGRIRFDVRWMEPVRN